MGLSEKTPRHADAAYGPYVLCTAPASEDALRGNPDRRRARTPSTKGYNPVGGRGCLLLPPDSTPDDTRDSASVEELWQLLARKQFAGKGTGAAKVTDRS
jgi:hypothetical protein